MATIAIGDIHGNVKALADVLEQLRAEASPTDTVVFLGDYIDRGRCSKQCIDAILDFREAHSGDVVCLCGNHEDWLLRALHDPTAHGWLLSMDGYVTIRSYSLEAAQEIRHVAREAGGKLYEPGFVLPYDAFLEALPASHLRFLNGLRRVHDDEHGIYVHAGVDSRKPLSEQTPEEVTFGWDTEGFPEGYAGERLVIYGHRNNASVDAHGWPAPRRIGRTIGLDTSRHGVVTAMRLPDQHVIQSRRFRLDE